MKELLKGISEHLTLKECDTIIITLKALKETIEEGQINDINELIENIEHFILILSLGRICIMDNEKQEKEKDKNSD